MQHFARSKKLQIKKLKLFCYELRQRGDLLTIYIDIIFLENLFMNYIILFATGIIVKAPIKIMRTFISSAIGSIYAIISYMSILEIYSNVFLKIILSIAMVYIAFDSKRIKSFLKQLIIFYLTSFTFGGVAFALLYFISPQNILMEKRSINRNISNKNNFNSRNYRFYYNHNSI